MEQELYMPSWLLVHVKVMVATIGVVIWKLFGGMLSETSSVGGLGGVGLAFQSPSYTSCTTLASR